MQKTQTGIGARWASWIPISALPVFHSHFRSSEGFEALLLHGEESPDGPTF